MTCSASAAKIFFMIRTIARLQSKLLYQFVLLGKIIRILQRTDYN